MALVLTGKDSASVRDIDERPAIVGSRFLVDKRIGEGSFGVIYKGLELNGKFRVAIKFENRKTLAPQLRDEFRTYRILNEHLRSQNNALHQRRVIDGRILYGGVPNVYYYGQETIYNCLVMDLLGPSLEELFDQCGRKFSVPSVCFAAIQMVSLIEMVHSCGLIYRDIKPDNFLIGPNNLLYVIDFGMAKSYRDPRTMQHIPYREKKSLSGTARYMSINTHLGREQSRRDDLEALGHVLLYFLRGSLPWQGLKAGSNKEKYERIGLKKQDIPIAELCAGFPDEFAQFLSYTRTMKFDAAPDYDLLRSLMRRVLRHGFRINDEFDEFFLANLDWSKYMSTWEPDLVQPVPDAEVAHLRTEAALAQSRSPTIVDAASGHSHSALYGTYDSNLARVADSVVGVDGNREREPYCNHYSASPRSNKGRTQASTTAPSRIPSPKAQANNSHSQRSWVRRLFCL